MEKQCFECLKVKPINEFYTHGKNSTVYMNKCKECTKKAVKKYRAENLEKVKEYDRNRPNKDDRVLKNKERLRSDPIAKQKNDKQRADWIKKNSVKRNAHQKLARAVLKGIIIRKFECEKCQSTIHVEAHHEDYEKPLDVIWLCSKCHHERHRELREIERQKEKNES
jgi:hypothetical protein